MERPLLEARGLTVNFKREEGFFRAVEGLNFQMGSGEVLGLVGESGSGKTSAALSLLKLLSPRGFAAGEVFYQGLNLMDLSEKDLKKIRGREIGVIFQEPLTFLNPVLNIGVQIMEPMVEHWKISWKEAEERALDLLQEVGIRDNLRRMREYPHQLSGGMRQRVLISMALACSPRLLIADEPATALDVTTQSQIIDLFKKIKEKTSMSILLVSHDLGVIGELCEKVMIMYGGRILEKGTMEKIFQNPLHPYTRSLIDALPSFQGITRKARPWDYLSPPDQFSLSRGCKYQPRCSHGEKRCKGEEPPLWVVRDRKRAEKNPFSYHQVRCWKYEKEARDLH